MKVLIIIDDLMTGGTEKNLLAIIKCLKNRIDFRIISLYKCSGLYDEFVATGIPVCNADLKNRGFIRALMEIYRNLNEFHPDIILCMRDISKALLPFFLRLKGYDKTIMRWENPLIRKSILIYRLQKIQNLLSSPFLMGCSRNVTEAISMNFNSKKKIETGYNCINLKDFKPKSLNGRKNDFLKIVSVGNLKDEKMQIEQIKIASELKKRNVSFTLTIAGEGPLRGMLEKEIKDAGLEKIVLLPGKLENISEFLNESDIFLFTSKSEGFCIAIIEALAAGLPCVIYDLPVLREIDPEGKIIQKLPQGDCIKAAEKIIELSKDYVKCAELGVSSRKQIEDNFNVEKISTDWERYFTMIIKTS